MSDFARGLILGGNIFKTPTEEELTLKEQHAQLLAALRESEAENTELLAEIEGGAAVLGALQNALQAENPQHPLVFPMKKNPNRHRIFDAAYAKAKGQSDSSDPSNT